MLEPWISQTQQLWRGIARLTREQLAGLDQATEDLVKVQGHALVRVEKGIDDVARLSKEVVSEVGRFGGEWRRAWVGAARQAVDAMDRSDEAAQ